MMDPNSDSNNVPASRGLYSPLQSKTNQKDGHTPSDNELSKECMERLRKLIENYQNYTVDNFVTSFRSNYPSIKLILLKQNGELDLKTQCFYVLEAYTKLEISEIQLRREFISISLNTLLNSSEWDEVCHRILKQFAGDLKQFVNLVQVEQFFEFTTRLLSNYPNVPEKEVNRLTVFISILELLLNSPLFTKNLVQFLPVLTKVMNVNAKDHRKECHFDLVRLACTTLNMFTPSIKQSINYSFYINELYTHVVYFLNTTEAENVEQMTSVLNFTGLFVNSGVNKLLLKSLFENEIFKKLFEMSCKQHPLICNVLYLVKEILKKMDPDSFTMTIFQKCNGLICKHWMSSDYKVRELCYNIILLVVTHLSKMPQNLDEDSVNRIYKFSIITFFNAANSVKDVCQSTNKECNGFLIYVKNVLGVLLEIMEVNYKMLIQLNNIKKIIAINMLQSFVLVVRLVAKLYRTLPTNRAIKIEEEDLEKNEFLQILENNVKTLCKTLESPYLENSIRLVMPILIYYYLNPDLELFVEEDKWKTERGWKEELEESQVEQEEKELERLMLFILNSFSRNYPDLFLQQYLSIVVQVSISNCLENLYKYSYNIILQTIPKVVNKVDCIKDGKKVLEKLLNENVFVGLTNNLESIKCIQQDINYMAGYIYNYYPMEEEDSQNNKEKRNKMVLYLKLMTVILEKINLNTNYNYIYDQTTILNKFLHKLLFYLNLENYEHVELLSGMRTKECVEMDKNEDLYIFVLVISMKNKNQEYMRVVLKLVNYILNFSQNLKLVKYALLLIESYTEITNINELYFTLSKHIKPLGRENGEGEEKVTPYFAKMIMGYLVGETTAEIKKVALNIVGKLGGLIRKYKTTHQIKSSTEFSLAFPCGSQKEATVVSIPVERGLDEMIKRLDENLRKGGNVVTTSEFDTYCGYLLVVMSPVFRYDSSLTQTYINLTKKTDGDKGDETLEEEVEERQMEYLVKMAKCLCLLLNNTKYMEKRDSEEFGNLLVLKSTLLDYAFLSGHKPKSRMDNVMMVITLFMENVDLEYKEQINSTEQLKEDSCLSTLFEILERLVGSRMEDALEYYVNELVMKINDHNLGKRISYLAMVLLLLESEYSNHLKNYYGYICNTTVSTILDLNSLNLEFLVERKLMVQEKLLLKVLKALINQDGENLFNQLTRLLNHNYIKLRLIGLQLLNEYKHQKVTHYFNSNFKNLGFIEIIVLSTHYTQNLHTFKNGLNKLLSCLSSFTEDSIEAVVYLKVLEEIMFDSRFDKLFKGLSHETTDQMLTTLINLAMVSQGLVFNLTMGLLKRAQEKIQLTQNVVLTLQPYVIQLQTVFKYSTIEKLMKFYEIYGTELNCVKDALYNVALTLNETKISISELQVIRYMEFFKFLNKLGYNNKSLVTNYVDVNNITTPIMMLELYENYMSGDGKTTEKDKTEKENKILEDLKLYDVLYVMEENGVKNSFQKLNNVLNNNNNLNIIYEVLCFLEYLSKIKSMLVSTKEFKNVIKTVVTLSNQDIFLGHYLDQVEKPIDETSEEEKDIDELIYIVISSKCYEILQLHYPSTIDILNQYNQTPYSYLNGDDEKLNLFNRFVYYNMEMFNGLYICKSTSQYLYDSKLMTLMRIVYFINNNEELVKGNLVMELMNYLYNQVLKIEESLETKKKDKPGDNMDEALCMWMGYYLMSKICHVCNINYLVVMGIFKKYIEFIKSNDFTYIFNNLQDVPLEVLLVMNNEYQLTQEEEGTKKVDYDEFNHYHLIMKKISFNFFNSLCNITIYKTVNNNKVYQPLVLYLFGLTRNTLATSNTNLSPIGSPTNADSTIQESQANSATVLMGSFIIYLNNYRKLMRGCFNRFINSLYSNNNQGYYFNRYALEIVTGIILIYESNQYIYNRFVLLTVYFRVLNNLKNYLGTYSPSRDKKIFNNIVYRYNGIISKIYKYNLLNYINQETNKMLYNNLLFKLLSTEYPQLVTLVSKMVNIPYLTNQNSVNQIMQFHSEDERDLSEHPEERTENFLELVIVLVEQYLNGNIVVPETTFNNNGGPNKEALEEEPEDIQFTELMNMVELYTDLMKISNFKNVNSLFMNHLPLFIEKLNFMLTNHTHMEKEIKRSFLTFLELCFMLLCRFHSKTQAQFLRVVEVFTKYHRTEVYTMLLGLYYLQPYAPTNKKMNLKLKTLGRQDSLQSEQYEQVEYEEQDDMEYNFFDYNGTYIELSGEVVDQYVITDLTSTNKRFYKIVFNQIQFALDPPTMTTLNLKSILKMIKHTPEQVKYDLICRIMYHTRYLSYPYNEETECLQKQDDEESLSTEYNTMYINVMKDPNFKNLSNETKMDYLTHCSYIAKTMELDYQQYYTLQESLYNTLEMLFKYNQNSTTLLNVLFTLFEYDIEIAISTNYPRFNALNKVSEEETENSEYLKFDSQINYVCHKKNSTVKPIVNVLKDFRKLSLSSRADSIAEVVSYESKKGMEEFEFTMDNNLYDRLMNLNHFNKIYLNKYIKMNEALKYLRNMALFHEEYKEMLFAKIFNQLYINLSDPYRTQMIKLVSLFMTEKIRDLSTSNNLYPHSNPYSKGASNNGYVDWFKGTRDLDMYLQEKKEVINLVYVTVINSYPLILLPIEISKYICYYLEGNYYNTCYYLEKLILTHPLDITRIASILSDVYMKMDNVDMSIGSNRCWVITNETRLALSNMQHSKWKQAQREFNQIMEFLSSSGQSSETVAWFDESKVWFNCWLYSTKQLNEWDLIRDISYISNNKQLFQESNIYLNSYPHLVILNQQGKDNYILPNQDPNKEVNATEVENILDMNIYNIMQRLYKIYNNNVTNPNVLYKQYNKDYYKFRNITENCLWWLVQYYKNMGHNLNSGHVNCMRLNQKIVEMNEGLGYLKRVTESLAKSQNINELHLINKWRNRLPNKSDQPYNWNMMLSFRTFVYNTVKNLMNITNNNQQQTDLLLVNQDYIWTLVKYSCVTRKSHQLPLMASVLLNKAQKYLVKTMNKSLNLGEDYYLLVNERLKQYLSFSINVPDALISVISLDFDKLPNKGFETLKAHVTRLKAEAINRNYIYDIHQNQNNPNKRQLTNTIGDIDLACKYMLEALKLQPLLSKNWISWAKFNDNKIDHSLISVWNKNPQMFPLELYETSIMGYLTAISINPNCHWLLIKRIFTLLNEIHRSINITSESFKKYSEYIHPCVWLTWLPQLVGYLYRKNNIEIFHLLKLLSNKVPQQVYYTVRTEYLSLVHNGGGSSSFNSQEEERGEENHNLGDTKNILQILINSNSNLNHLLENFCNVLTNMGRPDPIDEVLCAYETIFEECLDLPFHENIPKPMFYCITNKILSKLSTNNQNGSSDDGEQEEENELYNIVYKFTQELIKPRVEPRTPSNSPSGSENSERTITCGYTMNKLLDIINALVNYTKSDKKKLQRRMIQNMVNYNICNVSNKIWSSGNLGIQLPHIIMNTLDDILKNKNVLGEIYDILYVDPKVVRLRRRNQMVKCLKIVTTDGQNHYYSLYPLVIQRQRGEEYLYQMTQLFNFYFKKYNETRRRNLWIPSSLIVPLDPYICLFQDNPNNVTLLNIYNDTISLNNLVTNSSPINTVSSSPPTTTTNNSATGFAKKTSQFLNAKLEESNRKNGYETGLILLILHKILLEKNITNKLYECYNKYNPNHIHALTHNSQSTRGDDDGEPTMGFNYIYKLFKDKQYPWFITWYRKIHQDVLQDAYNKLCSLVPDNILLSYVLNFSNDYQDFVSFRMNFTASYATQAVLSLILATPYATPSRLVLNLTNGSINQLDYKLFNRDMEPNKLRVFRLTRNMTNMIGSICRLGLLPAVMFSVASSVHHFKIDIHAAMSAILSPTNHSNKDSLGMNIDLLKESPLIKENKEMKNDKLDEVDEYLSKILNYCSYLRSPADQEHSTVPINNVITCIIDASTDSSMLGKLKTSYQPWF